MSVMSVRNKTLASLMAQENLNVVFDDTISTAYFEPHTRKLSLPVWKIDDQHVIDFLITHEVGHALYSNGLLEAMDELPKYLHGYIRILEDCRVDRLQREHFPGTKKDYFYGTRKVLDLDVFKLNDVPVETMILIDRINMKSKFGLHRSVPFYNDIERSFAQRALSLETQDEVIELAQEIYEYEQQTAKTQEQEQEQESEDKTVPPTEGNAPMEGENTVPSDVPAMQGDESMMQDSGADDSSCSTEDGKADEGSNSDEQEVSEDQQSSNADVSGDSSEPSQGPVTDSSMDEWSSRNTEQRDDYYRGRSQQYITIGAVPPEKVLFDRKIFKKWLLDNASDSKVALQEVACIEKTMRGHIAALSKEFSVFKQARTSSFLKTNKGRIDVNRLHLHQINDNIFTSSIVSQNRDENHRLVFLLDVSGSMFTGKNIRTVMDQLLIFRRFCKNEGIKFNVISFSSFHPTWIRDLYNKGDLDNIALYGYANDLGLFDTDDTGFNYGYDRPFLLEVLNDQDDDLHFALLYKYLVTTYGYANNWFPIAQTPLNEAMSLLYGWFVALRRTMKEDKLSLMILTDGESTDRLSGTTVVRDFFTKREYTSYDNIDPVYVQKDAEKGGRTESYYTVYVALIVLKAMKENGIIDSCIWYNIIDSPTNIGNCDILKAYGATISRLLHTNNNPYDTRMVLKEIMKKDGLKRFDDVIPGIDTFFMYYSPETWQRVTKKLSGKVTNTTTIAADTFNRTLREKSIIKGLCTSVAKRIA